MSDKYPEEITLVLISLYTEVAAHTRRTVSILLCSIASRRMTRHKKFDDFRLSGAESFPTVYNMNDFAAIIFSLDF